MTTDETAPRPRVLPAHARYVELPRPDYEPHPYGVRPGAAPALGVASGLLLAVSPFGAWYRVTELPPGGLASVVVLERLGRDLTGGPALLVLGLLAAALAPTWPRRTVLSHAATAAALAAVGVATALLVRLQSLVDGGVRAAIADPTTFTDQTPGIGWGGWAAVAGTAGLLLAVALALLARTEQPDRSPGGTEPRHTEDLR